MHSLLVLRKLDIRPICHHLFRMAKAPEKHPKALMVGLAFDSDGHKRVTTGKNFALLGGTEETHDDMTEKAMKINERLAKRGKELHEVSREEFDEIAGEVGLTRQPRHNQQ